MKKFVWVWEWFALQQTIALCIAIAALAGWGCSDGGSGAMTAASASEYLQAVYPGYEPASAEAAVAEAQTKFFYYPEVSNDVFPLGLDPERQDKSMGGWPYVPGSFLYIRGPLDAVPDGCPVEGYVDSEWVEVCHTGRDDVAFWMMWCPGSGIYWNLGGSLVGLNKSDVLLRLGYTVSEIEALWVEAFRPINEQPPTRDQIIACMPPEAEWADKIVDPEFQKECEFDAGGPRYPVIDEAMVSKAKDRGFDSLQIVKSWSYEWLYQFVDVNGIPTVCGDTTFMIGEDMDQTCECDPGYGHLNCGGLAYTRSSRS